MDEHQAHAFSEPSQQIHRSPSFPWGCNGSTGLSFLGLLLVFDCSVWSEMHLNVKK